MADGDELVDMNDRVLVMNRMADDKVEIPFNGVTIPWKPREIRSIQRTQAFEHFIPKSRVLVDPTGENPGVYKLVAVDNEQHPIQPDDSPDLQATTEPLTKAKVAELTKFGFIDATHLAPDRTFGADSSMQLQDPETGQSPARMELRGGVRERPIPTADAMPGPDRAAIQSGLRELAPS